jgi:hypothetical protein
VAHIIAGYLQQQEQVQDAIHQLVAAGYSEEKISSFYVNPAGQHDLYPVGGDEDMSPGAKESIEGLTAGMAAGGAVGAAVGMVTLPFSGPAGLVVGALVGAHIGSLAGSMSSMKESGEVEEGAEGNANAMPHRKSGMMVAVCVPDPAQVATVVQILQAQGGVQIEHAEGTISAGDWIDFNPLAPPALVKPEVQPAA